MRGRGSLVWFEEFMGVGPGSLCFVLDRSSSSVSFVSVNSLAVAAAVPIAVADNTLYIL